MPDKTFSSGRRVSAVSGCVGWCRRVSDFSGSSRARVRRIASLAPPADWYRCGLDGVMTDGGRRDPVLSAVSAMAPVGSRSPEPVELTSRDQGIRLIGGWLADNDPAQSSEVSLA